MKQQTEPLCTVTVLSVGPADNGAGLEKIFARCHWSLCPQTRWAIESCASIDAALSLLRKKQIGLVICESRLAESTWREMFDRLSHLADPPFLIVTSRLADDRLWAEALNIGAYDVLARPFDASEVERTLSMAWLHREHVGEARPQAKPPASIRGYARHGAAAV